MLFSLDYGFNQYLPGILASNVSINQNVNGLLGINDTHLTCSFIQEKEVRLLSIEIIAKNMTEDFDDKKPIAIFKPDRAAKLHSSGEYLSGRVTLTNITNTSTNATLKFHKLKCIDEKDYICKYYVIDMDGAVFTARSETTRILVKAPPSKPDIISSVIVSSKRKETQFNRSSNFFRGTNKTSVNFEQSQPYVSEWWTVMFTCTGNIGIPPGKLIWQKISPQQKMSVTYSNETTEIEELPEKCSFRGTSNLTIEISGEDLKAKIRCFETSQANVQGIIHSEVSDDQEEISVDNDYEEIGSVSYHEVNLSTDRIETSNQPITEGEIVSEIIPISTSSTSSESSITMIHFYVNTDIFNTNEHLKMSANNETAFNHPNELGNVNIGIDESFVNDNSESDTLQVHQYVNMTSPRVRNIYQDLNHTTVDTHKYESLNTEGNTTVTE
ncbi:unnamed protein product [Mytilus coruscus]|uniref:Ig-like domain-containing protein n=1 Tax=Mytilus coruscus TaxID=42192 RepID=A0A6J8DKB8_MYTCO|nr:unnamed protein product [Mytilus coruscus]